jgi:hypothetical protein
VQAACVDACRPLGANVVSSKWLQAATQDQVYTRPPDDIHALKVREKGTGQAVATLQGHAAVGSGAR